MSRSTVSVIVNPLDIVDRINSQKTGKEVFKIGISANLGGHTRELYSGVGLAVQEYLDDEERVYDIELLWEKSSFKQDSTIEAASQLLNRGAEAIIGHLSANQSLAAAGVYSDIGIPFFAPGTTHPLLTGKGYDNILRVCGRDESMASEMVKLAKKLSNSNQLKIVYQENKYGEQLSKLLSRFINESGLHLEDSIIVDKDTIANIDHNDTVLFAGTYEGAVLLTEQIRASNFRGPVIFGDDAFVSDFPLLIKANENFYIVSTKKDLYSIDYGKFSEKYSEFANMSPAAYSITSYLSAKMLLENISILKKESSEKLINKLKEGFLLGERKIYFSPNGDILDFEWDVYKVKNGEFININRSD